MQAPPPLYKPVGRMPTHPPSACGVGALLFKTAYPMSISRDVPLTELLAASQRGDVDARETVAKVVYSELHDLASAYLRREGADNLTLQPTSLVGEAYLRLLGQDAVWQNRSHFFGIAAQAMRRILVDRARHRSAQRRDRSMVVTLDDAYAGNAEPVADILGVNEALERLAQLDPRQAQVVELKFFVGLSLEEIAEVLEISRATVSREWTMARAWLARELADG